MKNIGQYDENSINKFLNKKTDPFKRN